MARLVTAISDAELICCKCAKRIKLDVMAVCVEGRLYHPECTGAGIALPMGLNRHEVQLDAQVPDAYATIQPDIETFGASWRPVVVVRGKGHTPDHPSWRVKWVIGDQWWDRQTSLRIAEDHARTFGLGFLSQPPQGLPHAQAEDKHDGADHTEDKV